MKVGDLVIRKINSHQGEYTYKAAVKQRENLGPGLVLSVQWTGAPRHRCVTVWYPKVGKAWEIASNSMEVVSECR